MKRFLDLIQKSWSEADSDRIGVSQNAKKINSIIKESGFAGENALANSIICPQSRISSNTLPIWHDVLFDQYILLQR